MKFNAQLYRDLANCIRVLTIDAVEAANSGHPGMPLGMADIATVLFAEALNFRPNDPLWPDRDRFILSAGHGSMLLYALLYLTGYEDITLDDIRGFRKLGSKTAGHPEYGLLKGIECSTGPLGQGIGNGVGMAIANKIHMAKSGAPEHKVWVIAGDGCLMEGISHEACSLAGHLQLNNLILLHDNNGITIDGKKSLADSEDTIKRFEAYGWYTQSIDGHDFAEISAALANARASELPAFISCRTIIGYGAPTKAGSEASHGAALGKAEASQTKASYGWEHDRHFHVPEHLLKVWRHLSSQRLGDLSERLREPRSPYHLGPQATGEMSNCMRSQIVRFSSALHAQENLTSGMTTYESTRKSSGIILSELTHQYPWLIGGSADLTESNYTSGHSNRIPITRDNFDGNYIYYGIREHAMGAVMNGLALSGLVPYGGSFLVFIDYCKPAVRLAALMKLQVIYVMTHDSIGLGEDGPTHQPIEQLASLRSMPNISVLRPADTTETRECWQIALESTETPTVLCLTRQDVPQVRSYSKENLCKKGAYVLSEFEGELKVTIFATGSEVSIALDAQKALHEKGIGTRIISMPSMELFERQSDEYKSELLDQNSIKVAVEAASRFGWDRYIGRNGIFIGMDDFGASGKGPELYKHFGITSERICAACLYALAN